MARKYDLISELYSRTCKTVVMYPQNWEAFLRSACRNFKLRFDEQLLVYAQRPDATAVLEIERWNGSFGRWVNRGAHGIAVFEDADRSKQRLIHYFDISDTHESRYSRPVPIWQMKPEYSGDIIDTLESTFGELDDKSSLEAAILSAAKNAVEDNIPDYLSDLLYSVENSLLDGVDEEEISVIYKETVQNSVAYMLMSRLGLDTEGFFEPDDFRGAVNFTTPETLNALGFATSDIAEMGLTMKLSSMNAELQSAKGHFKNMGLLLVGRAAKEAEHTKTDKGILSRLSRLCDKVQRGFSSLEQKAMDAADKLRVNRVKASVKENLNRYKAVAKNERQAYGQTLAPQPKITEKPKER